MRIAAFPSHLGLASWHSDPLAQAECFNMSSPRLSIGTNEHNMGNFSEKGFVSLANLVKVSLEILSFSSFSKTKTTFVTHLLTVGNLVPAGTCITHRTSLCCKNHSPVIALNPLRTLLKYLLWFLKPNRTAQNPNSLHTSCSHPSCSATFPFPEALLAHLKSPIRNPSSSTSQLFLAQEPFGKGGGRG